MLYQVITIPVLRAKLRAHVAQHEPAGDAHGLHGVAGPLEAEVIPAVGVSLAILLTLVGYGMLVFNMGPADALTYLAAGDSYNFV